MEKIVSAGVIDRWFVADLSSGQKVMTEARALGCDQSSKVVVETSGQGVYIDGHPLTLKKLKEKCGVGS